MANNITIKSKATKNKNAVLPKQATGITGKKFLKITIFFFIAFLITGSVYIIVSKLHGKTTISGFQWCKSGNTLKLKGATLTAIGLEDYKSPQYEDKVCHLTYIIDNISSKLYLDEIALVNFNNKEKDRGNGCVVYHVEKTQKTNEVCFGSKVKETSKESQESISPTSSWKTLTNDKLGITIVYPDLFKYGLEKSKTEEMIQIASYDLDKDYGLEFPPGIKLEIVKEANTNNLSLFEWAGQHSESVGGSFGFEETQISGLSGLKRYVQENNLSTLTIFVAKNKSVYTIFIIGQEKEYNLNKTSLEKMLNSFRFN